MQRDIDSLDVTVTTTTAKSYEPLLKDNIFTRDIQVLQLPDSLRKDKTGYRDACLLDSIPTMTVRQKNDLWNSARAIALNSRNSFSFDETAAKEALNQLYRSKVEWHRKISLPVSIIFKYTASSFAVNGCLNVFKRSPQSPFTLFYEPVTS